MEPASNAPATLIALGDPPAPQGDAPAGLGSAEAAERLRADGPNALGGDGRRSRARILASQFASPLVLILVAASCVSIAVGDAVFIDPDEVHQFQSAADGPLGFICVIPAWAKRIDGAGENPESRIQKTRWERPRRVSLRNSD